MVNVEISFASLKATWVSRILSNPNSNWSLIGNIYLHKIAPADITTKMSFDKSEMLPTLHN